MSNKAGHVQYDDFELVSRCQKGDVEAFGGLVARHQKKMFNISFRMIGDYDEAAEVVQEAFFSAFKAIKKFRGEASFSTWITGIVLNHAKNRLKKIRTTSFHEPISLDEASLGHEGAPRFDPPSAGTSLESELEKRDVEAAVQECINSLDKEFREALILRDIQELSYEEISTALKIPDGTVKSRINRGREALRKLLKRKLGDW